jgi:hypothetical protein
MSEDGAEAISPSPTTGDSEMDDRRREIADKAFADYDLGDEVVVEGTSGWEYTSLGQEWTRAVFVATDQGDTCGAATTKLTFTVRFTHGANEIEECYAIDTKGCIWGRRAEAVGEVRDVGEMRSELAERMGRVG